MLNSSKCSGSTASRFHTLKVLLSTAVRCLLVLALGANPIGVVVFEVSFIAANHWQHSNVGLPAHIDSRVRWFAVTPNMHRTHHSIRRHELDSNFGTIFSCWDRLLGTYNRQGNPAAVRMGLAEQQGEGDLTLWDLLAMPFTNGRPSLRADLSDQVPQGRAGSPPTIRLE